MRDIDREGGGERENERTRERESEREGRSERERDSRDEDREIQNIGQTGEHFVDALFRVRDAIGPPSPSARTHAHAPQKKNKSHRT